MAEVAQLVLPAQFDRSAVEDVAAQLRGTLSGGRPGAGARVQLDLSGVERFDSAGMALIVEALREAKGRGVEVRLVGVREPVLDFFSLLSVRSLLEPEVRPRHPGLVERTGRLVCSLLEGVVAGCELVGRSLGGLVLAPWRRERVRGHRLVEEIDVGGSGAVPIVALIGFLLGLILAMQAWVQLRVFAAEVFVADMVAVGVTREIGPLMTAILVAARSGSAIAAQLGTMVINEEVAALRQMGIHPNSYLVAPKIVALALATPGLTALFCMGAMLGGLLFGVTVVGMDPAAYLEQTQLALRLRDVLSALFKATVFGVLVAGVGCTLGLRVTDGAEGVGRATTRAVVAAIFLIIVCDALFVVLLRVGLT